MKSIPDLMIHQIRKENPFEYKGDPHPSLERNRKAKEDAEQEQLKIYNAAKSLRANNPDMWKIYEGALLSLYTMAKELQNKDHFEMLAMGVNPDYYALTKAHAVGQVQILESILSISQVPIENLKPTPSRKKSNKIVDIWRKCISFFVK